MTQDDRMETIADPAENRATDEPDPFRRNPVAQTGPDDPWRFTRFVADDHECVIVRDEYDEPAPFGSCATHRRALSSPVALGCATPAPVGAAVALNLDAARAMLNAANTIKATGGAVEIGGVRIEPCDEYGSTVTTARAESAEAEVGTLRANWRHVTKSLGYGDGVTEPQIGHVEFVAECERQFSEASEWRESQRWRDECHDAGHPDDEDCYEHDPALVLLTLRAKVAAVEALVRDWPCSDDTCDGDCTGCAYASDLRAALAVTTGEGECSNCRQPLTAEPCSQPDGNGGKVTGHWVAGGPCEAPR